MSTSSKPIPVERPTRILINNRDINAWILNLRTKRNNNKTEKKVTEKSSSVDIIGKY